MWGEERAQGKYARPRGKGESGTTSVSARLTIYSDKPMRAQAGGLRCSDSSTGHWRRGWNRGLMRIPNCGLRECWSPMGSNVSPGKCDRKARSPSASATDTQQSEQQFGIVWPLSAGGLGADDCSARRLMGLEHRHTHVHRHSCLGKRCGATRRQVLYSTGLQSSQTSCSVVIPAAKLHRDPQ